MGSQQKQPVWKICLGQLGPNLQEAAELADVLQEVSAHIQVTGLTRTLTARTSTSSGNPTRLSAKDRIKRAAPLDIGAGAVPWSQLVAVVSSAELQEPSSPDSHKQPQVLEVNSGGAVYFLFFNLKPQQQQQQQPQQQQLLRHVLDQQHATAGQQQQQQQPSPAAEPGQQLQETGRLQHQVSMSSLVQQQQEQQLEQPLVQQPAAAQPAPSSGHTSSTGAGSAGTQPQPSQQHRPALTLLQLQQQQCSSPQEGVAVLKVGGSRLAMQAEQFANELTRHLGIAAPDCRIVRQVGSSAAEWSSVLAAVQQLAEPQQVPSAAAASPLGPGQLGSSGGGSSSNSSSSGCQVAAELQAELQHLPCFLLMEYVAGSRLLDCPHAVDPAAADVGQLCEDVGRLFLLDMLLGNADRMSCPELGWRGNPHNLLYARPGSRHSGRAVAIDSCVARRPPALKASAEDAAVERLSQLMLAVPGVSLVLLQQLLGPLRQKQQQQEQQQQRRRQQAPLPGAVGLCSQLSMDSFHGSCSGQPGPGSGTPTDQHPPQAADSADTSLLPAADDATSSAPAAVRACNTLLGAQQEQEQEQQQEQQEQGGAGLGCEPRFSEQEVARFLAGVRQCLDGVLQIKGLLEMVSAKIAEWIAEFVEDVVRMNPALLPNPASPSPAAMMRSPKPSPRLSGRNSFTNMRLEPAAHAGGSAGGSSLGGVFDAMAAAAAAGRAQSPGPPAVSLGGSSFSSRLQAAAGSVGGGSAGGAAGGGRLVLQAPPSPPPEASPAQQPAAASAPAAHSRGAALPPVPAGRGPEAGAAAASAGGAAAASGGSAATAAGSSGAVLGTPPKGTPPRGLLKQLVGGSGGKAPQPLTRGFAAIKAAICSPRHSSSRARSTAAFQGQQLDPAAAAAADPSEPPSTPPPATSNPGAATSGSGAGASMQQHASTPCSPPASVNGSHSGPGVTGPSLDGARSSSSSDLATAVAAALSPRANAAQAEALAGLFGGKTPATGRACRSMNGAVSGGGALGHSLAEWREAVASAEKPPCARRVTWTAAEEALSPPAGIHLGGRSCGGGGVLKPAGGTFILEEVPVAHKPASLVSAGGASGVSPLNPAPVPSGWCSSPPAAALSPAATKAQHPQQPAVNASSTSAGGSRNSSSSPVQGQHAAWLHQAPAQPGSGSPFAPSAGREVGQVLPAALSSPTPPAAAGPAGFDSFLHRQYNTRHLSFTSGGGGGDGSSSSNSPAGVAASLQAPQVHAQQQQRSSSSSLQVLASLQLDATLASITQEARHDGALAERLAMWKANFREKGGELSAAIASWQQRHQLAAVLSTGFLDGSHPIVDAYELGVRLQHMLRRLTALAAGSLVQVPIAVLPGVFLGNAVAADSHHLLQYLGVTHVLNAAQELQLTPDPGMFHVLRVAIRDEEEEDVTAHFNLAQSWIDAALLSGGAVLVHCHEGKSRSVTLLLAYLMMSRGLTLAAALGHMRSLHPKASPNAGFMAQLMRLDKQLHGACSIQPSEVPRAKPEARICSICGAAAGVSYESLVRHTKAKHGLAKPPSAAAAAAAAAGPAAAAPGT